ncbi:hypothetical protein L9F63_016900, partial [Diploptera punctata]
IFAPSMFSLYKFFNLYPSLFPINCSPFFAAINKYLYTVNLFSFGSNHNPIEIFKYELFVVNKIEHFVNLKICPTSTDFNLTRITSSRFVQHT